MQPRFNNRFLLASRFTKPSYFLTCLKHTWNCHSWSTSDHLWFSPRLLRPFVPECTKLSSTKLLKLCISGLGLVTNTPDVIANKKCHTWLRIKFGPISLCTVFHLLELLSLPLAENYRINTWLPLPRFVHFALPDSRLLDSLSLFSHMPILIIFIGSPLSNTAHCWIDKCEHLSGYMNTVLHYLPYQACSQFLSCKRLHFLWLLGALPIF